MKTATERTLKLTTKFRRRLMKRELANYLAEIRDASAYPAKSSLARLFHSLFKESNAPATKGADRKERHR